MRIDRADSFVFFSFLDFSASSTLDQSMVFEYPLSRPTLTLLVKLVRLTCPFFALSVEKLTFLSFSALHQLSRVLANHLGKRGITSNTIACGPFQSKMMAATLESAGDLIVQGVPLHRIGTPEDVAGTCIFLSSRAGSYVNGATITLDGGSVVSSKL